MAIRKQRTEILVGLFVFVGLAIMGTLIIQFGRFSDRVKEKYDLTVDFPDASGLRKGVPVRLGGSKIGFVAEEPFMKEDYSGLELKLKIFGNKQVPKGSKFLVGTSGLMGDTFVQIEMPENYTGEFYEKGAHVTGSTAAGLGELQGSADAVLKDIQVAVRDIQIAVKSLNRVFDKIETKMLSDENLDNLTVSIADFRVSSENIKKATVKFDPLMDDVKDTVAEAKLTMTKAGTTFDTATETVSDLKGTFAKVDGAVTKLESAISKAEPAMDDLEPTIKELKSVLENANIAISAINSGDGVAAALISDSQLKADLQSFADKLEKFGILKYPKNTPPSASATPSTGGNNTSSSTGSVKKSASAAAAVKATPSTSRESTPNQRLMNRGKR